jgi:hypothetical protein
VECPQGAGSALRAPRAGMGTARGQETVLLPPSLPLSSGEAALLHQLDLTNSLGLQVLSYQTSVGPSIRKRQNHPLPGTVWIRLFSLPV